MGGNAFSIFLIWRCKNCIYVFALWLEWLLKNSKLGVSWLNKNMSEILFDQMLKLFTVSVKNLIDNLLPVWYKKMKTFLEQIHYLPNLIVTIIEKNWFLPPPLQKFLWYFPVFTCSPDLQKKALDILTSPY